MKKALALALLLVVAEEALARLGGGQSYSGSSRSSGGGYRSSGGGYHSSGGGDGQAVFFILELLFRLIFFYPQIGVPLLLVAGFMFYYYSRNGVTTVIGAPVPSYHPPEPPVDPNFSAYLFRDFVGLLYTQVQLRRAEGLAGLRAYLSPQVEQNLQRQKVGPIREVVVGSLRVLQRLRHPGSDGVIVELEANYSQAETRVYSRERWTFSRRAGVASQTPEQILKLACPSCGNPGEIGSDGTCPFCQQVVNQGNFAWVVSNVQVIDREERKPMLVSDVPESGTNLPTVRHPNLAQRTRTFRARYPDFDDQAFIQRVRFVFIQLQEAWSQQRWELARPYETDSLFQTHRYWIEAYQRDGLVNQLSQIECTDVHWSNIETDAFFDAITVRVFGSMIDVTVRKADQKVLAGNPKRPRRFSEYWTLIRRVGYQPPQSDDPRRCPSCGAPLDQVNQAGSCEYCGTHLTLGEFDWVLAQIEQDESYRA